jgi:hypothetical protein
MQDGLAGLFGHVEVPSHSGLAWFPTTLVRDPAAVPVREV